MPLPACLADPSAPCLWDGQAQLCPCDDDPDGPEPDDRPRYRGRPIEDVPTVGELL